MTRAPITLPGQTVIFDYGEVISLTPSAADREVIAGLAGVGSTASPSGGPTSPTGTASTRAAQASRRTGRRSPATLAPAGTTRGCTSCGRRTSAAGCPSTRAPSRCSPTSRPATPAGAAVQRGPGLRQLFPARPARRLLRSCYVSGELGLLKPHPEIYRHVLDDLGISAAEAVFIDNREANVRGAEALGITGHVFTV